MLNYSMSTVLMTVLTGNLLILLISLIFRNNRIMLSVGYRLLAVFAIFTFIRFIFPFEFPFSVNIIMPQFLSILLSYVRQAFYSIGPLNLSVWFVMEVIWGIGIIIGLVSYYKEYRQMKSYIRRFGNEVTSKEPYAALLKHICSTYHISSTVKIVTLPGISVPMFYGMKTKYILLPQDLQLSDNDMYYIFCHELSHCRHRDLWLKSAIRLVTILYWWNPICHVFKRQTDIIIEMRVDASLTQTDKKRTIEYLNCLIHMAELAALKPQVSNDLAISFFSGDRDNLEKRFHMLCKKEGRFGSAIHAILMSTVAAIYMLSYLFIFEPSYTPPETKGFTLSDDNSYIVITEDGSYDIYLYGIFIENVESLDSFSDDIPVYTIQEKENLLYEKQVP